jgi:uncharacterized protein (TIGR02466 family)
MSRLTQLFVTNVYQAPLGGPRARAFNEELLASCLAIARDDGAGRAWAKANAYKGYTSYASLNDLAWRDPTIADLVERLGPHVTEFAKALDFDLGGRPLELDSLWINVLEPGGTHTAHIHPNAAVSGTYYVALPEGARGLRIEDPRHAMMMAAPPKRARAKVENRPWLEFAPKPGDVLLWESFLRHDVPRSDAKEPRVSVSFNYRWG